MKKNDPSKFAEKKNPFKTFKFVKKKIENSESFKINVRDSIQFKRLKEGLNPIRKK